MIGNCFLFYAFYMTIDTLENANDTKRGGSTKLELHRARTADFGRHCQVMNIRP